MRFEKLAGSPFACTRRTAELRNFLPCPGAVRFVALILYDNAPRGWYVLARVGGTARIADIRVDSGAPADWTPAYALAVRAARRAAPSASLRFRRADPVFVLDPKKRFAESPPLNVTFLESDHFRPCRERVQVSPSGNRLYRFRDSASPFRLNPLKSCLATAYPVR